MCIMSMLTDVFRDGQGARLSLLLILIVHSTYVCVSLRRRTALMRADKLRRRWMLRDTRVPCRNYDYIFGWSSALILLMCFVFQKVLAICSALSRAQDVVSEIGNLFSSVRNTRGGSANAFAPPTQSSLSRSSSASSEAGDSVLLHTPDLTDYRPRHEGIVSASSSILAHPFVRECVSLFRDTCEEVTALLYEQQISCRGTEKSDIFSLLPRMILGAADGSGIQAKMVGVS